MKSASVRTRFLFSIGANAARALLSLVTGLIVARGLNPAGYGDLTYLLGSFVAIRALLDLGSSNAFYTFISRQARSRKFYALYFSWVLLQFVASLLLVAAVLPQSVLDQIWFGHSRAVVVLALAAAFMQQQVWTTITQLGESARLTVRVQSLGLSVVVLHCIAVGFLALLQVISVPLVLAAIVIEYLLAMCVALALLRLPVPAAPSADTVRSVLREYWQFCRPLIVIAASSFLYDFADKWLLQRFAGSSQQGFYQIASQLAAVSLLATISILNIFWKEIAEASARGDQARLALLYRKVNRGLFVLAALVSCFLIPWSRQLVQLLLGEAYQAAWPVLALMLLYPVHQSMGQVNATMFMACERTTAYMRVALFGQLLSLPVSYVLLATPAAQPLPGLGLGAYGLAFKMVGMNLLLVNLQAWMIARFGGWRYEWSYQWGALAALLLLGFVAREAGLLVIPQVEFVAPLQLAGGLSVAGVIYCAGAALLLWMWPAVAGLDRSDLRQGLARIVPQRLAGPP